MIYALLILLLQVYHGSVTQYAFILINVLRISACLGLRWAVLKAEDRHAESWKAGPTWLEPDVIMKSPLEPQDMVLAAC